MTSRCVILPGAQKLTVASGARQMGEAPTTWCRSLAVLFKGSEALEGPLKVGLIMKVVALELSPQKLIKRSV